MKGCADTSGRYWDILLAKWKHQPPGDIQRKKSWDHQLRPLGTINDIQNFMALIRYSIWSISLKNKNINLMVVLMFWLVGFIPWGPECLLWQHIQKFFTYICLENNISIFRAMPLAQLTTIMKQQDIFLWWLYKGIRTSLEKVQCQLIIEASSSSL